MEAKVGPVVKQAKDDGWPCALCLFSCFWKLCLCYVVEQV